MSRQAIAKITQAYDEKPLSPQCVNCRHYCSELRVASLWGQIYERTTKQHCGIGGFKVKKTGTCQLFQWKEAKA